MPAVTSVERTLTVSGLSVALREAGDGPSLMVVHHSTGPLWTPFYDRLAGSFSVMAPDVPGYGRSERPEWARSPRDVAILLIQLLDEIDAGSVHLVGMGFGGWIAAEMATMNQRRFSSLVLVGAVGLKPRQGDIHDPLLRGFEEYVRMGFRDESRFEAMFGRELSTEIFDLWDHSREMTARLNWKPWMFSWELPNLLPAVRVPSLVIWGSHDNLVPLDCAHLYTELLPDASISIVDDAGHNIDLEKPEQLAELITAFCSQTT